ncbi:hypothetical protein CRENBAI_008974, partial [Crenichthys baileyi]
CPGRPPSFSECSDEDDQVESPCVPIPEFFNEDVQLDLQPPSSPEPQQEFERRSLELH